MSTINNTMTLGDKVTPSLNKMIASMERTLNMMNQVNRSLGNVNTSSINRASGNISRFNGTVVSARRSITDTTAATQRLSNANEQVSRSTNNASNSTNRLRTSMQQASNQANNVTNKMSSINFSNIYFGVQAFMGLAHSIENATNKLDEMGLTAARLNNINDGLQTTEELNQKIFDSANRMGMGYTEVAKQVSKLNLLASENLGTNDEAIAFVELLNKIGHISGSSGQEIAAGIYQINQAMAAGKLQGDEFRSVMETFPMFADYIAQFTNKTKGQLKAMSSDGVITADIMKQALFSATDEINEKFSSLPKTFKQQMTIAQNYAEQALKPVAERFSQFINTAEGIKFFENMAEALVTLANVGAIAFEYLVIGINFVNENLWLIATIVATVAAIWLMSWALAHAPLVGIILGVMAIIWILSLLGLTSKDVLGLILIAMILVASYLAYLGVQALITGTKMAIGWLIGLGPIGWIILGIIAIITVVLLLSDNFSQAIGFIIGILFMLVSVVMNVGIFFYNIFGEVAVFLQNVFQNPVGAIIQLFLGLAESCLEALRWVVQGLQDLINMLPGVEVQFTNTIDNMIAKVQELKAEMAETFGIENFEQKGLIDFKTAFNKGSNLMKPSSKGGAGGAKNPFTGQGSGTLGNLKVPTGPTGINLPSGKGPGKGNGKVNGGKLDSVGKIEDDVTITDEDIKMLKDIATTDFINSYTTLRPEMKVEFTGPITETADINKILGAIEDMAEDALSNVLLEEVG